MDSILQDCFEDFVILEEMDVIDQQNNRLAECTKENKEKEYRVRPRKDHFNDWDDREFLKNFRLKKSTVNFLLSRIRHKIQYPTKRNHALSPMQQLLLALRFYSTGSFYEAVGDFVGIHKSTAHKTVKRVTTAIAELSPQFIQLPSSDEERKKIQDGFFEIAKFPRVMAALGCTHVQISSPGGENADKFRNQKGDYSINVQAMCDSQLLINNIIARWPGATHNSTIFDKSVIKGRFEKGEFDDGLILGDARYACNNYLITPLEIPSTAGETRFNESQICTRNVIEQCFGAWKRRFPILQTAMRCHTLFAVDVIVCTAVLHNIARQQNDEEPEGEEYTEEQNENEEFSHISVEDEKTRKELINYFNTL